MMGSKPYATNGLGIDEELDWHLIRLTEMTEDGRRVYALFSLRNLTPITNERSVVLVDANEYEELIAKVRKQGE